MDSSEKTKFMFSTSIIRTPPNRYILDSPLNSTLLGSVVKWFGSIYFCRSVYFFLYPYFCYCFTSSPFLSFENNQEEYSTSCLILRKLFFFFCQTLKCLWNGENNYCLFKRPFKIQENGVFLFGISFFVLEILTLILPKLAMTTCTQNHNNLFCQTSKI